MFEFLLIIILIICISFCTSKLILLLEKLKEIKMAININIGDVLHDGSRVKIVRVITGGVSKLILSQDAKNYYDEDRENWVVSLISKNGILIGRRGFEKEEDAMNLFLSISEMIDKEGFKKLLNVKD